MCVVDGFESTRLDLTASMAALDVVGASDCVPLQIGNGWKEWNESNALQNENDEVVPIESHIAFPELMSPAPLGDDPLNDQTLQSTWCGS